MRCSHCNLLLRIDSYPSAEVTLSAHDEVPLTHRRLPPNHRHPGRSRRPAPRLRIRAAQPDGPARRGRRLWTRVSRVVSRDATEEAKRDDLEHERFYVRRGIIGRKRRTPKYLDKRQRSIHPIKLITAEFTKNLLPIFR